MKTENPLRLSLARLPRQIGATLHEDVDWAVPGDISNPVMRVPEGTVLPLSVDFTAIDDGVLVSVATAVDFEGECVRCLEPLTRHHDVAESEVYFEVDPRAEKHAGAGRAATEAEEIEDGGEDEIRLIDHDTVDLEPMVRDMLVPLLEDRPLDVPDCLGLCDVCGIRLADAEPGHHHESLDPRMAELAGLLEQMGGADGGASEGSSED